jgi:hypothetical protein
MSTTYYPSVSAMCCCYMEQVKDIHQKNLNSWHDSFRRIFLPQFAGAVFGFGFVHISASTWSVGDQVHVLALLRVFMELVAIRFELIPIFVTPSWASEFNNSRLLTVKPFSTRNVHPSTSLLLPWPFAGNLGDVVGIKGAYFETGLRAGSGVLAVSSAGMMFVEASGRRTSLPLHLDGLPTCWIRLPQHRLVNFLQFVLQVLLMNALFEF